MITKESFNIKKKNNKKKDNENKFLSNFLYSVLIKTLIVIVLFLSSMIYIKQSDNNKEKFKNIVYNNSLSFAKIYDVYQKYLGDVIPFKNIFKDNTKLVSSEKINYESIEKKDNGYILSVSDEYTLFSLKSGIVIKIEESNVYKSIITIQDKTGLNISYGLINNVNVSLYDYVEKGEILGICNKNVYLEFKKDDKYLSYEEYL